MQNIHLLLRPYRQWLYQVLVLLCISLAARAQDHVLAVQLPEWGFDNPTNIKTQIDEMANNGVTAVHFRISLSDLYSSYIELTSGTGNTTKWGQYDEVFNYAYSKGMKVALSINVTVLRENVDAFFGGSSYQYLAKDQWDKPALINPNGQSFGIVSLAYSNGVDRLKLFVNKVVSHFNNLHSDAIVWTSVTTTAQWEFGYNYENHDKTGAGATFKEYSAVYDYSSYAVDAFRTWLSSKYGNNINSLKTAWGSDANGYGSFNDVQPPKLSVSEANRIYVDINTSRQVFTANVNRGKDWYDFQQSLIKSFASAIKSEIQGINSNIKYVQEYGSNVDEYALLRIAYDLKSISDDVDGLKTQFSDFQWDSTSPLIASDLVRTNTNKPIYTEINPHDVVTQSSVPQETANITEAMLNAGKSAINNGCKWVDIIVPSWHQLNQNSLQDKEYAASKLVASGLRTYTPVYITASTSQCVSVQDLISNYGTVISNWMGANNSGNTRVNVTLSNGNKCLSVSKQDLLVGNSSSTQTFKIYASNISSWSVSTADSWLSFNTTSGSSTTDINVTLQANSTGVTRKGKVTVSGDGFTRYINVYQNASTTTVLPDSCYTIKTTIAGTNLYVAPASGNQIQQAAPSGTNTQAWRITTVEPGYYKIVNAANPTLVLGLDVEDCTTLGDKPVLKAWANNDYQKWQIIHVSGNNWTFLNKAICKSRAILVPGNSTTAGTILSTYELISPSDAQQVFTLSFSSLCPCVPPAAPTVTASSSTICTTNGTSSTLTASGCSGTVTWNGGQTGSTRVVSATGTYSATCTVSGCGTASAASNVITITNSCPVPPTGCYTIKTTIAGTNLYLEPTSTNLIQQAAPTGTNKQAWHFIEVETGYFKIVNSADTTLVLGLEIEDCITSGDRIKLRSWTNNDYQKWQRILVGSNYSFVNKASCKNRAILVPDYSTAAGTIISTYDLISPSDAQQVFTLAASSLCPACTPPAAPTVTASSSTICTSTSTTATLTATGCSGTVTWSTGQTGSTRVVSATGTYSATCTISGCVTPSVASNVVTISNSCKLLPGCYTIKTTITGTNLYLAPASASLIQQTTASGTNTQAWQFIEVEPGYYKIVNAANTSQVLGLEIEDCSTSGDRIMLRSWTGNDYQKWQAILVSANNYTFVNKASCKQRAILVPGYSTSAGTILSTYDLISPSDQQQVFTLTTTSLCSGCTPPAAPTVTASSATVCNGSTVTLTASGCSGTVTWSGGQTGSTRVVGTAGTYSATCTVSGCSTASIASEVVTINNCSFQEGCYTIKTTVTGANLYLAPASGNLVQQASASGTNTQAWQFTEVEPGYYKIVNAANTSLVLGLEVEDCSTTGDRIMLRTWTNNDYQKWQVIQISANNYTFVNKALCKQRAILVPGYSTSAGTILSTYDLISPSDQQQVFTLTASGLCSGGARIRNDVPRNDVSVSDEPRFELKMVTPVSSELQENQFVLYPNPAHDQIEVKFYLPSASRVSFTLYNVQGIQLDKHDVQGEAGINTHIFKLHDFKNGIYVLKGVFGSKQDSKKFVIER
ncbi:RICIN domain-containing protein [Emticicia sp. 17c]|uniref:RICIN domain-containing protein n=1 Tax=Emticicia sp. 17c TaxID=3127704 RepID=UPI00301D89C0